MAFVNQYDTIAAIATATGNGGIGIVRISGENAITIANSIFVPFKGKALKDRASHTISYGNIVFGDEIVDEVLVSVMKAPNTYTCEDVVEINCHGGYRAVSAVLDVVLKMGARMADPGEFTKRAFLNGRIDLTQAEAVIDVINAGTEQSRQAAMLRLEGKLSQKIKVMRDSILTMLANIEVDIDYPEHDGESMTLASVREGLAQVIEQVKKLIEGADTGRILKEGIKTVILGRPNVGKSSLLNALLEEERAIVTDIPGTTRDVLEEMVNIGGLPVSLIDTAGIRATEDIVEKMGVERSKKYADEAELILTVIDSSSPLTQEDKEILQLSHGKKSIIILNKIDLEQVLTEKDFAQYNCQVVNMSAKNDLGLEQLGNKIKEMFLNGHININSEAVISGERNKASLIKALSSLENALNTIDSFMPEDFISMDLSQAYEFLGEITGEAVEEDILDRIFSEFCLGK